MSKATFSILTIEQIEARIAELRNAVAGYEAQFKDPTLNAEFDLSGSYESLIDEAEEDIAQLEERLETLRFEASAKAATPARRFYSNTACRVSADDEYYGRGYVSARGKNYRSCHIWRVGKPDQVVNESNDEDLYAEEGGDCFYDEDGEPRFVALCESQAMATALCALLNENDALLGVR